MGKDQEKGFLGRWAQRKQAARAAEVAPSVPEGGEDAEISPPLAELDGLSEAEQLEKLGLPDPDNLVMGDNFAQFLQKSVPQGIRKRALRRLWTSNPVLANLDGLNDYEQDFTDLATNAKNVMTSYVVGEGFAKRVKEVAEVIEAEAPASLPEVEAPVSAALQHDEAESAEPDGQPLESEQEVGGELSADTDVGIARRRMQFS